MSRGWEIVSLVVPFVFCLLLVNGKTRKGAVFEAITVYLQGLLAAFATNR